MPFLLSDFKANKNVKNLFIKLFNQTISESDKFVTSVLFLSHAIGHDNDKECIDVIEIVLEAITKKSNDRYYATYLLMLMALYNYIDIETNSNYANVIKELIMKHFNEQIKSFLICEQKNNFPECIGYQLDLMKNPDVFESLLSILTLPLQQRKENEKYILKTFEQILEEIDMSESKIFSVVNDQMPLLPFVIS